MHAPPPPPRKRFGQHFLTDPHTISKIIDSLSLQEGDALLEIGPGRGALTQSLYEHACPMWAVEIDRDLAPILRARFPRLNLFEEDALSFNYHDWAQSEEVRGFARKRLIGNLPYNIASPLLFEFIGAINDWHDLTIMVQKEVAQRMMATPESDAYGRLSVMMAFYFSVKKVVDVRPGAFFPPPKVMSTVVRLIPKPASERPDDTAPLLSSLVKTAFAQRRKKLSNSLRSLLSAETLVKLGYAELRAENLSLADYLRLCHALRDSS